MNLRWLFGSLLVVGTAALGGDELGDNARALSIQAPARVVLGDTIPVRVTFENAGASTWDMRYGCVATWRTNEPDAPLCAEDEHRKVELLPRSVVPGEWLVLELSLPTIAVGPHAIVVQLQTPDG